MKISKKRKKMVSDALSDAFQKVYESHFDQDDMRMGPSFWSNDIKERFDMLTEMQFESNKLVFEALTK